MKIIQLHKTIIKMKPFLFQFYCETSIGIFLTYRLIKLKEFCNKVTKVKLCKSL